TSPSPCPRDRHFARRALGITAAALIYNQVRDSTLISEENRVIKNGAGYTLISFGRECRSFWQVEPDACSNHPLNLEIMATALAKVRTGSRGFIIFKQHLQRPA
ncbi:MAG: hypothetical protein K6U74_11015, partial [Firmicutes bacterium]|nr:hypothetical protein [Bacillota bacterium]